MLGEERIKKARSVLNKTDLALIVADGNEAAKDFSFEHQILALTEKEKYSFNCCVEQTGFMG